MWVALRSEGVGSAFVVDTKKGLWLAGSFDRIDCNSQTAVGAILEAEWHGEPRGHLAVCLALGACAPIADQLTRSAMYCGVIGSSSSVAVGKTELDDV